MNYSNYARQGFRYSVAPITIAADQTAETVEGAGIDLKGFESATFIIAIGAALVTTDADYKLQESADNITFTDVAAADIVGDDTILSLTNTTGANKVLKKGYIGTKRYIRIYLTITTGSGGSWPHSVLAALGNPRQAPVASA